MKPTLIALVAALDVGLALVSPKPAHTVVLAIVAPLTRVPGLGLGPAAMAPTSKEAVRQALVRVIEETGTPEQRAWLVKLRSPPNREPLEAARRAMQADAVALATLLGPERVQAMLAARPALATKYGELRIWDEVAP